MSECGSEGGREGVCERERQRQRERERERERKLHVRISGYVIASFLDSSLTPEPESDVARNFCSNYIMRAHVLL